MTAVSDLIKIAAKGQPMIATLIIGVPIAQDGTMDSTTVGKGWQNSIQKEDLEGTIKVDLHLHLRMRKDLIKKFLPCNYVHLLYNLFFCILLFNCSIE